MKQIIEVGFSRLLLLAGVIGVLLFGPEAAYCDPEHNPVPEKLVLGSIATSGSAEARVVVLIYEELSKRLGIPIEIRFLPAIRAANYAREKTIDGEAHRYPGYNESHPELVRVEEPIVAISIGAYAMTEQLRVEGWESLRGKPIRIEHLRGNIYPGQMITRYADKARISMVDTPAQGLKKLVFGRTDLYIDTDVVISTLMKQQTFSGYHIRRAGTLGVMPLHMFIVDTYGYLAPKITGIIRELKADGTIDAIFKQTFDVE